MDNNSMKNNQFQQNGMQNQQNNQFQQNGQMNQNMFNQPVQQVPKKKKHIGLIILGIIAILILINVVKNKISESKEYHETLTWPSSNVLAQMLPEPSSKYGVVESESERYLSVDVYQVKPGEFDDYISACKDKGFTVDYYAADDSYSAKNNDGYSLMLDYEEERGKTMNITLSAPGEESDDAVASDGNEVSDTTVSAEDTEDDTESDDAEVEDNADNSDESESSDASGVDPDFKATMDAYEKTMNAYCDFMDKYANANPTDALAMAADYTKMMTEYANATSKIQSVNENDLSGADLAYYTEVMARVNTRLAKTATTAGQ